VASNILQAFERGDLTIGAEVDVIIKADESSGRVTRGHVREFLTRASYDPQGIKVRLMDYQVGGALRTRQYVYLPALEPALE